MQTAQQAVIDEPERSLHFREFMLYFIESEYDFVVDHI